MREINDEQFNGPLDLLLQLIEQEQMDIGQISLAKVTDQYIAQLQSMEEMPVDELADFLVVAAKLILIKSRLMIPGEPVTDDAGYDLERQLRMYKAYVDASKNIERLYNQHVVLYPRDGYQLLEPIFNPPPHITADILRDLFGGVLRELEPITRLPQTVLIRTINIREKIAAIHQRLIDERRSSFHQLLRDASTKADAIVTFLAVLELVKQRSVQVFQGTLHADVAIEVLDQPVTSEQISEPVV